MSAEVANDCRLRQKIAKERMAPKTTDAQASEEKIKDAPKHRLGR